MRNDAARRRSEAERYSQVELIERSHLAVEPGGCVGPMPVRPAQTRPQVLDSQPSKPSNSIVQPVIFEVEPLADAHLRR